MHWMDDKYQARFYQEEPQLSNTFAGDHLLQAVLKRLLPADVYDSVEPGLQHLGERAATDLLAMAEDAEKNEPELVSWGPWGRRIDEVQTSQGWKDLDRAAAEEGVVADAYSRKHGDLSRIGQLAKLYLYNPSSAIYSCPLAMTDGAARLIEVYGDDYLKERAYKKLTSMVPEEFWTSGQWMTERTGGSDISGTETVAREQADGTYKLFGTKFFTSAVTAQMAMTLARIEDKDGNAVEGSRGLSLFYLELRRADGQLNEIEIHRLKDKLGTRALPTAELSLHGTQARLMGGVGHGVRKISTLFNVTRIYNATCAVSAMQRCMDLARDFSARREAFGAPLNQLPAHLQTLAEMEVEMAGAVQLVFEVARLLGKDECGTASDEESRLLRILTPLAKLYTGKQAVALASETVECFGGGGYMEDTGIPKLLRDVQTLSIWEGTTNVLSLDMLRAAGKEDALPPLFAAMTNRIKTIQHPLLQEAARKTVGGIAETEKFISHAVSEGADFMQASARSLAFSLTRLYVATLLLEQAEWALANSSDHRPVVHAERWCAYNLTPLVHATQKQRNDSEALANATALTPEVG